MFMNYDLNFQMNLRSCLNTERRKCFHCKKRQNPTKGIVRFADAEAGDYKRDHKVLFKSISDTANVTYDKEEHLRTHQNYGYLIKLINALSYKLEIINKIQLPNLNKEVVKLQKITENIPKQYVRNQKGKAKKKRKLSMNKWPVKRHKIRYYHYRQIKVTAPNNIHLTNRHKSTILSNFLSTVRKKLNVIKFTNKRK